jgi:hypothetical protein
MQTAANILLHTACEYEYKTINLASAGLESLSVLSEMPENIGPDILDLTLIAEQEHDR